MLITVRKFWDFRLIFAVEEFRLNLQIATKSESILKKIKKKIRVHDASGQLTASGHLRGGSVAVLAQ